MEAYIFTFIVGVSAELGAYAFSLWGYRKAYYPLINILLVFTVIYGSLCALLTQRHLAWVLLIAGVIGIGYEWLNFRFLHWWQFPTGGVGVLKTPVQLVVGVGLLWAGIPLSYFIFSI